MRDVFLLIPHVIDRDELPFSMASGPVFSPPCRTLTLSGLYVKVLDLPFLRLTVRLSLSGRMLVTAPLNTYQLRAAFFCAVCAPVEPSYWLVWLVWLFLAVLLTFSPASDQH